MTQLLITSSLILVLVLTYLVYSGKDTRNRYYIVEIPVHLPVGDNILTQVDIKMYSQQQYKDLSINEWKILHTGNYQECLSLFHQLI